MFDQHKGILIDVYKDSLLVSIRTCVDQNLPRSVKMPKWEPARGTEWIPTHALCKSLASPFPLKICVVHTGCVKKINRKCVI